MQAEYIWFLGHPAFGTKSARKYRASLHGSKTDVSISTAEIVANSPQFRRKSSIFVDAIHDLPEKADLAPAQLYSTESGRLFHSGRIVIITVGLPARGKT